MGLLQGNIIAEQLKPEGSIGKYEIVSDDILKLFKKGVQTIATSLIATKYMAKKNDLAPNLIKAQYHVATVKFNLALSKKTAEPMISLKFETFLLLIFCLSSGTLGRQVYAEHKIIVLATEVVFFKRSEDDIKYSKLED